MANELVQEIRLGLIRALIWQCATDCGVRYSVAFAKLYKAADQPQDAGRFGRDDLLLVSKLADLAHAWICKQKQPLPLPENLW